MASGWSHLCGDSAQVLQGREELRLRAGTMVSTVATEGRCSLGGHLGTDQLGPRLGQEAREAGNPGGRRRMERREGGLWVLRVSRRVWKPK